MAKKIAHKPIDSACDEPAIGDDTPVAISFAARFALNRKKTFAGGGSPKKVRSFVAITASETFFSDAPLDNNVVVSNTSWLGVPVDVSEDRKTLIVALVFVGTTIVTKGARLDDLLDLDITVTNGDGTSTGAVAVPAVPFEANPTGN